MSDLRALYQEIILDHYKSPRNFKKMENADRVVEGYNPLCGDHYTFYLKFEDDDIKEISFQGSGCAISKASASVMGTMVKGKRKEEAEALFNRFHRLVTDGLDGVENVEELGRLAAFAGVSEFPARVKCATLAWHAMKEALHSEVQQVSTE